MIAPCKYTIFVIDDDLELIELLKKFLTKHNVHVLCARDGDEGLFLMKEYPVHIAICDVLMPHTNGIECVRRV